MVESVRGQRPRTRAEEVTRPVLLDTSFLIDLEREIAQATVGPARRFLDTLRGRRLVVSVFTAAELLEGEVEDARTRQSLQRFTIQGLHFQQAERYARLRRRATHKLSQNDAWLVATADSINADVVGADRAAFERLGARYLR